MAITTYTDFVNNYLTKNGMIGNAANINKAPDQLKLEIDELNSTKADKLGKLSQFASTTSAELAGVISDETGSGKVVFSVSPALTGTPTAPTAASTVSSTQIATTAFAVPRTSTTGSARLPVGTTGQRDASPVDGMIRYNSTTMGFEGYFNGQWQSLGIRLYYCFSQYYLCL